MTVPSKDVSCTPTLLGTAHVIRIKGDVEPGPQQLWSRSYYYKLCELGQVTSCSVQ